MCSSSNHCNGGRGARVVVYMQGKASFNTKLVCLIDFCLGLLVADLRIHFTAAFFQTDQQSLKAPGVSRSLV